MDPLFLILARGGSKGVPGKNIKPLGGKPLIHYSIDLARQFVSDEFICVSTDSDEIIKTVEDYGLKVPFKRPDHLATDTADAYAAILHALDHYEAQGLKFEKVVLLQPSSPYRKKEDMEAALKLFNSDIDMILGVKETDANPYFVLLEEDPDGNLTRSKPSDVTRRQDAPEVYQANGSLYILNTESLRKYSSLYDFPVIRKYIMDPIYSVDIDTPMDWQFAEFLLEKGMVTQ